MTRHTRSRAGFALISVLWILVGISALAMAAGLAAREAVASARNRVDLADAAWRAEGCLERARAAISGALAAARNEGPGGGTWGRMDRAVAESPLLAGSGCDVAMIAAGAALDVNAAPEDAIHRALTAHGVPAARADSLVDALADWRDADAVPRPRGAERAWYLANGRRAPRDGTLADGREIARVRGFDGVAGMEEIFSTEPGRVPLGHAPPAVLASLPGFTPEAVARVVDLRARGQGVGDLSAFPGALSPGARDALLRRFTEFVGAAAAEPEAWIVRARAGVGTPAAVSVVEVRLVRAGDRAAIVRRKTWTE
ncbi:MAG: general secretion pathway protein GspK [Gemmatimonadetes bacterium]|nr:general secretion pathway protein GspK [Gemmatimonadota bacterium]